MLKYLRSDSFKRNVFEVDDIWFGRLMKLLVIISFKYKSSPYLGRKCVFVSIKLHLERDLHCGLQFAKFWSRRLVGQRKWREITSKKNDGIESKYYVHLLSKFLKFLTVFLGSDNSKRDSGYFIKDYQLWFKYYILILYWFLKTFLLFML